MPVTLSALDAPRLDPTSIFEQFRWHYASELLTAAVAHFRIFDLLAHGPLGVEELQARLGLADRPMAVLLPALRALGLLELDAGGRLDLSELAREHLLAGGPFDVSGYIGLHAESADVLALVERLRSNRPAGVGPTEEGAAFIYREGVASAMEQTDAARRLTLALAGRARNVAPVLAERVALGQATTLLDVGGGTGIYSIAFLQKNPHLRAIVWDRPEVLKVAAEFARDFGVSDRLTCLAGDMFAEPVPPADVVLLSNILHDWDIPECQRLIGRCAETLPAQGRLIVHDVFLDDDGGGPLAVALYSAALFSMTEGRAYSGAEYCSWLRSAGLHPGAIEPTLIHCGALSATKYE